MPIPEASLRTYVKGQDEVLSDGLLSSVWADSRIPCWWPGDLRWGFRSRPSPPCLRGLAGGGVSRPGW
jgi:hypothetical protein